VGALLTQPVRKLVVFDAKEFVLFRAIAGVEVDL